MRNIKQPIDYRVISIQQVYNFKFHNFIEIIGFISYPNKIVRSNDTIHAFSFIFMLFGVSFSSGTTIIHRDIRISINCGGIFRPYKMYNVIESNVVIVTTTITIPNNNNIPKIKETL